MTKNALLPGWWTSLTARAREHELFKLMMMPTSQPTSDDNTAALTKQSFNPTHMLDRRCRRNGHRTKLSCCGQWVEVFMGGCCQATLAQCVTITVQPQPCNTTNDVTMHGVCCRLYTLPHSPVALLTYAIHRLQRFTAISSQSLSKASVSPVLLLPAFPAFGPAAAADAVRSCGDETIKVLCE